MYLRHYVIKEGHTLKVAHRLYTPERECVVCTHPQFAHISNKAYVLHELLLEFALKRISCRRPSKAISKSR